MSSQVDPQLVDNIVHEVKSQGVFDEFRKDSISDVDTKPAYQNLRQRVENTVNKFLSDQRWTPETNKNQLREKLRKHLVESGFLDVGVERIVDQVVNPKIGVVFQPRIEEIAYKYVGIPMPPTKNICEPPTLMHPLPPFPIGAPPPIIVETASLLPTDLEQISPDSDRKLEFKELTQYADEKIEDDEESPPFEPLVKYGSPFEKEIEVDNTVKHCPNKTNMDGTYPRAPSVPPGTEVNDTASRGGTEAQLLDAETQDTSVSVNTELMDSEKEISRSLDAVASQAQESQLSQVSSNSRISGVTLTQDFGENTIQAENQSVENVAVNISEEAQMPNFNENSSETKGENVSELHFDIKKDEIKFEGTERKTNLMSASTVEEQTEIGDHKAPITGGREKIEKIGNPNNSFQFTKLNVETIQTPIVNESSFGSSLEDMRSAQMDSLKKGKVQFQDETPEQSLVVTNEINAVLLRGDKTESTKHLSSSSRHKRHSGESRRSYEKDRRRSKDRERSRDSHSKSKSSSSRSKHISVRSKISESYKSKSDKRSVYSRHYTTSSSCSSSRSEANDLKRDKYANEKKGNSSNSNSNKVRDRCGATGSKKGQKKSVRPKDDHNESKDKLYRRKSTDSNDDNKGNGTGSGRFQRSNDTSKSGEGNALKSSQSGVCAQNDESGNQYKQQHRNVVILNDLLENPTTNFIELDTTSRAKHVLVSSRFTYESSIPVNGQEKPGNDDLLYFEEIDDQFTARVKLLDEAETAVKEVLNSLRYSSPKDDFEPLNEKHRICEDFMQQSSYKRNRNSAEASLLLDCIQKFKDDFEKTPQKRFKRNESCDKTSPTLSDASVNSKENEMLYRNDLDSKKYQDTEFRNTSINKMSQQRYNSEELYKPRPILSHRTRRRGMDSII